MLVGHIAYVKYLLNCPGSRLGMRHYYSASESSHLMALHKLVFNFNFNSNIVFWSHGATFRCTDYRNCIMRLRWTTITASTKRLTTNVDLQLTDACFVNTRKLYDEISVRRQVAGTLQADRGRASNSARVLTADGVVPERRCRDGGRDIGQTDDEIVRSVLLKQIKVISINKRAPWQSNVGLTKSDIIWPSWQHWNNAN